MSITEKKTETNLDRPKNNRQKTFSYFIGENGERVYICKRSFCDVFGETLKFILSVTNKKISSLSEIPSSDKRGKHIPRNKYLKRKCTKFILI